LVNGGHAVETSASEVVGGVWAERTSAAAQRSVNMTAIDEPRGLAELDGKRMNEVPPVQEYPKPMALRPPSGSMTTPI
jgi:hypothetical protein